MKIIITDKIDKRGIELLKKAGHEVKEAWEMPKEDLPKIIGDYEAIIVRSATKVKDALLDAAKKLKVVGRAGIGLDNVDVEKCKQRKIAVVTTPLATTESVAELTLAYLLALPRMIVKATASLKANQWIKKDLEGFEVNGKTLGIIGCGRIGSSLAKKATALGMKVIGYDVVTIKDSIIQQLPLEEVLKKADYISLHLPLNDATKNMISKKQFDLMKNGVYFINCSRGGIVDENTLYDAIVGGKVRGAAIDVWEKEPIEAESSKKLLKLDQVIGSPHIGAQTFEGQERAGVQVAEVVIEELKKLKK